ncbi:hypothetical protein [Zhongshania aquimaris]|uniref:Tetratricopeptide repeat protein n=1 Tax=Zhongshania aquimaris TaxID=2857107 RepID=A0ABS6VSA5_9GAMM|nr:hypothetical protein [Zhongshania aquimaris]MBW2941197.1 hypothetical protein [Zhongshania aquimaris]
MKIITLRLGFALLIFTAALSAFGDDGAINSELAASASVAELQTSWAAAQYQEDKSQQEHDFESLLLRANNMVSAKSDNPDLYVWRGIIKASYAGVKGGLGALSLVKEAKVDLERAIALGGGTLQAAARTSLGSLYFQVPGWPIGFGSDKKAETYLLEGLAMAPDDIDSNYFYALYLIDQRQGEKARQYLERAYTAPRRLGRAFADQERRREVLELITEQQKQK